MHACMHVSPSRLLRSRQGFGGTDKDHHHHHDDDDVVCVCPKRHERPLTQTIETPRLLRAVGGSGVADPRLVGGGPSVGVLGAHLRIKLATMHDWACLSVCGVGGGRRRRWSAAEFSAAQVQILTGRGRTGGHDQTTRAAARQSWTIECSQTLLTTRLTMQVISCSLHRRYKLSTIACVGERYLVWKLWVLSVVGSREFKGLVRSAGSRCHTDGWPIARAAGQSGLRMQCLRPRERSSVNRGREVLSHHRRNQLRCHRPRTSANITMGMCVVRGFQCLEFDEQSTNSTIAKSDTAPPS